MYILFFSFDGEKRQDGDNGDTGKNKDTHGLEVTPT